VDLFAEFESLIRALNAANLDYAVCGGFALAVHGFPRATQDVDLLLPEASLPALRSAVEPLGYRFEPRPLDLAGGRVRIYRLTKFAGIDHEALLLDILTVTPATRNAWDGRLIVESVFGRLPVVSKDGLIGLKQLRSSGQDLDDIRKLETGQ
jgi:hypothetical protein